VRGDDRWDETWHRLQQWTDGQGPSERLAAQVLLDQGFTDLDPSHPLGGRDGAADALARHGGKRWVMAVYFPRGQQGFKEIKDKFLDDFKGVETNEAEAFAFVTNQELRRAERRELMTAIGISVAIFHLERLVAVLDQPRMHGVRRQYLGISAPDGTLDRPQRVEELWRASIARCAARWTGVGIPPVEARILGEDRTVGAVDIAMCPSAEEPLVVWTAPMGSGKSIASERHHQASLETAAGDEKAPVPVFLRASECLPSLQAAIETAAAEVGAVWTVGATVVVDGVDEVGYQAAGELLTQARVLVGTWPATTLLMTSRAVPVLTEAPEHKSLPALDETGQEECVEMGAGDRGSSMSLFSLAQPVRATVAQPFFALLVGVWTRERGVAPRAPIDLMAMLGDRATKGLTIDQAHLRELAVISVARELGPVPSADVLEGAGADALLATGMLERRGGGAGVRVAGGGTMVRGPGTARRGENIRATARRPGGPGALALSAGARHQPGVGRASSRALGTATDQRGGLRDARARRDVRPGRPGRLGSPALARRRRTGPRGSPGPRRCTRSARAAGVRRWRCR